MTALRSASWPWTPRIAEPGSRQSCPSLHRKRPANPLLLLLLLLLLFHHQLHHHHHHHHHQLLLFADSARHGSTSFPTQTLCSSRPQPQQQEGQQPIQASPSGPTGASSRPQNCSLPTRASGTSPWRGSGPAAPAARRFLPPTPASAWRNPAGSHLQLLIGNQATSSAFAVAPLSSRHRHSRCCCRSSAILLPRRTPCRSPGHSRAASALPLLPAQSSQGASSPHLPGHPWSWTFQAQRLASTEASRTQASCSPSSSHP